MRLLLSFLIIVSLLPLFSQAMDEKYIVDRRIDEHGNEVVGIEVPGRPPDNYRAPIADPSRATNILSGVPALDWAYGCSATSAAMIAGYWDRNGLPNMYNGQTNTGLFPLPSSGTNYWGYDSQSNYRCPLSATQNGIDGRSINGHVDSYWTGYGNSGDDPASSWPGHTHGLCTADYMGTNQDYWNNSDGATSFYWNFTSNDRLHDYTGAESGSPRKKDGAHGLSEFFESRGYDVYQNFSQPIYGYGSVSNGFTFNDYKRYIDAGHPVMIQVDGHTMLGTGYNDTGNTVYLHDTWDYSSHTMTWGGSYQAMAHYGVSVFVVEAPTHLATPYTEDFEKNYLDSDWRLYLPSEYSEGKPTTSSAHGGSYSMEMTGVSSPGSYWGYSDLSTMWSRAQPGTGYNVDYTRYLDVKLDLTGLTAPKMDFWYSMGYSGTGSYNNFWVLVDGGSGFSQVFSRQTSSSSIGWTMQSVDLSSYSGQVTVRFFHNGRASANYLRIDDISVVTGATAPVVSATTTASGILYHRAQSGGTITSDGNSPILQRGVLWAQAPTTPTFPGSSHASDGGTTTGSFDITMTMLMPNMTYNYCSYAFNAVGITYGPVQQFTTPEMPPEGTGTAPAADGPVAVPNTGSEFFFTGTFGTLGNDITVDELTDPPASPGAAFLAQSYPADFSIVVTNNTGFSFTNAEVRFNIDILDDLSGGGIDQSQFLPMADGQPTGINLWRRSDYGTGDFLLLGAMNYHSNNGINGDPDDYLFYNVASFSEFTISGDDDHPLPVELSTFDATCTTDGMVELQWTVQSESDLAGYHCLRSENQELEDALQMTASIIQGQNSSETVSYQWIDIDVYNDIEYWYWLQSVDLDGTTRFYGPRNVLVTGGDDPGEGDTPDYPLVTALLGNYPNPFNPSTRIQYNLAEEGHVRIEIYNLRGQLVRVLQDATAAAGLHSVVWDGRDAQGNITGTGVFLCRMITPEHEETMRILLLK